MNAETMSRAMREVVRTGVGQALYERDLPEGYLQFDVGEYHVCRTVDPCDQGLFTGAHIYRAMTNADLGYTRRRYLGVSVLFRDSDLDDLKEWRLNEYQVIDRLVQRVRLACDPLLPSIHTFRIGTRNRKRLQTRRRAGQRGVGAHHGLYRLRG